MNRCLAPSCSTPVLSGQFCAVHAKAPAGQRGGWLSAAKKKPYDANAIAPRLWIGSKPPFDRELAQVDVLVLCAQEIQPAEMAFQGTVLRCPLPDSVLSVPQVAMALMASVEVAHAVADGQRALVTCAMGLNRSSLVAALALAQLTTMSGAQLIEHVRKHRGLAALRNDHFQRVIKGVVGDGRPRARRLVTPAS